MGPLRFRPPGAQSHACRGRIFPTMTSTPCRHPCCRLATRLASLARAALRRPRRAQVAPQLSAEETVRSWSTARIVEALNWTLADTNEASAQLCLRVLQERAASDAAQESELTNV